ncbi:MAG: YcxB family protein [Bacteroidota bacterium]
MPITTNSISLSPVKLFKLALRRHFEDKKWMLFALVFSFVGYVVLTSFSSSRIQFLGIVGYGIILTFFLIIPIFYWTQIQEMRERGFFKPRVYEIDDTSITAKTSSGKKGVYPWETFKKVTQTASYYILYISTIHFLYIEKQSFQSKEDKSRFDQYLTTRGLVI